MTVLAEKLNSISEQKRNFKQKIPYRAENMDYDPELDHYYFPAGKDVELHLYHRGSQREWLPLQRKIYE
jgi:hypothetical protein